LKGAVFSAPHLGHLTAKGSPHSPQNFLPLGFSDPHFEQRISASPPPGESYSLLDATSRSEIRKSPPPP
jgi:hypothetical protein